MMARLGIKCAIYFEFSCLGIVHELTIVKIQQNDAGYVPNLCFCRWVIKLDLKSGEVIVPFIAMSLEYPPDYVLLFDAIFED